MPNMKTTAPFKGTKEQEKELRAMIDSHRSTPGLVMPILQQAQDIYGYLPEQVLQIISEEIDVSVSELYGVVSFYAQFATDPKGKHQVNVCMGTPCYVKGAQDLLDRVEANLGCKAGKVSDDGMFSIEGVRCVGACGLAPLMIIDGDVHCRLTVDDVDGILAKYKE